MKEKKTKDIPLCVVVVNGNGPYLYGPFDNQDEALEFAVRHKNDFFGQKVFIIAHRLYKD